MWVQNHVAAFVTPIPAKYSATVRFEVADIRHVSPGPILMRKSQAFNSRKIEKSVGLLPRHGKQASQMRVFVPPYLILLLHLHPLDLRPERVQLLVDHLIAAVDVIDAVYFRNAFGLQSCQDQRRRCAEVAGHDGRAAE